MTVSESWSTAELVRLTGVSSRTLRQALRRHHDRLVADADRLLRLADTVSPGWSSPPPDPRPTSGTLGQ